MDLRPFVLERYFAAHEFAVPQLLCASDPEPWVMSDLLDLADEECRGLWDRLRLGYTEAAGHPLLRAEIAATYDVVSPDDIVVCSGAEEAVFLVLTCLLSSADHAVVVWPAYQSLYEVARATGARVSLVPLAHERGWELDVDQVAAAMADDTKAVVVNFPHNPTGALPPSATLHTLVDLARSRDAVLVCDEVYRLLEYDPADRWTQAADADGQAVSINVMTKTYGLGGLRIGWVATRNPTLAKGIAMRKDYTTICNSAPSEVLALIGLRARDQLLTRTRGLIERNLTAVRTFFDTRHDQYAWVPPRAGPIAFPRLLADVSIEQFTTDLAQEQGVLLLPGSVYGATGNHFRIGFGRLDCPEALDALARFTDART